MFQTSKLDTPVSFPKDESEWYQFLDGRVDQALAVKNYINNLPETTATFHRRNIEGLNTSSQYERKILKFMGAWEVPTNRTNHDNKWVNPNYIHAHRYSDAIVDCACGTPMLRENFSDGFTQPTQKQEHGDCNKIERLEARAEFLKNRRDIAIEAYEYGHGLHGWFKRLGYEHVDCFGGRQPEQWGIDKETMTRKAREKQARTCMVLGRKHGTETLGELLGYSGPTISRIIRDETVSDPKVLYSVRRATA